MKQNLQNKIEESKDNITLLCLQDMFLNKNTKLELHSELKTFSSYYNVNLKKGAKIDKKAALLQFIDKTYGKAETINKIYNAFVR